MNPAERYAMNLSSLRAVPQGDEYGTVPVPTGNRNISVPGANQYSAPGGSTFVPYSPKSQTYDYQFGSEATSNGMPTWAWVAIAAAGGLILFYALK
jgi:hypothetical protein